MMTTDGLARPAGAGGHRADAGAADTAGETADHATLRRWTLALVLVGVLWRTVRYLLRFPVWGDEAFSCLNLASRDYLGLLRPLEFKQVAPLLFWWGERTAYHLLGTSELALRLLPFLA